MLIGVDLLEEEFSEEEGEEAQARAPALASVPALASAPAPLFDPYAYR